MLEPFLSATRDTPGPGKTATQNHVPGQTGPGRLFELNCNLDNEGAPCLPEPNATEQAASEACLPPLMRRPCPAQVAAISICQWPFAPLSVSPGRRCSHGQGRAQRRGVGCAAGLLPLPCPAWAVPLASPSFLPFYPHPSCPISTLRHLAHILLSGPSFNMLPFLFCSFLSDFPDIRCQWWGTGDRRPGGRARGGIGPTAPWA